MNVTAVSMNTKAVIPQVGNTNRNYTSIPNNSADSFHKSVSFKSRASELRSAIEELRKALPHLDDYSVAKAEIKAKIAKLSLELEGAEKTEGRSIVAAESSSTDSSSDFEPPSPSQETWDMLDRVIGYP